MKIATCIPSPSNATSLYRASGVTSIMGKIDKSITFEQLEVFRWDTLAPFDMLFLQRPQSDKQKQVFQIAKNIGLPIWVDYDDDMLCVPPSNPHHAEYNKKNVRDNILFFQQNADLLTVSTKAICEHAEVIPNALMTNIYGKNKLHKNTREKIIIWRGSATHETDLMQYIAPMKQIIGEHPEFKFIFIGGVPWWASEELKKNKNTFIVETIPPDEYFSLISQLKPWAFWVPLEKTKFNFAKSNIAALEAAWAGAATLSPMWDEWTPLGASFFYSNESEFYNSTKLMLSMSEEEQKDRNKKNMDTISLKYNVLTLANKRISLIAKTISEHCPCF